jgi:YHS domain-containing protein
MNSASAATARAAAAARSAAAEIPADPMEALDLDDNADVLDLDAVARQAREAATAATPLQIPSAAPLPLVTPGEDFEASLATDADQSAAENPFTGVGLDDSRDLTPEFTDPPATPAEEFDPTLPAFSPDSAESDETNTAETTPADNSVTAPSEPLQSVNTERMRIDAEQIERRRQLERIQARPDLTGFKGFCPVALRDQRQLVDARPQIQSTFGLHTWTFSSDEARLAFETDPQRYAPAAGGADVVLLSSRQEEVPGKLDFALWYRGRLHLFSSRETMATFLDNPQQFSVVDVE